MAATESAPRTGTSIDEAQRRAAEGDLREFLRLADETGELVVVEGRGIAAVQAFRARKRQQQAPTIPPEVVETGPVFENVLTGDDVNVLAFPTPKWHDQDGGPYIGTECL